MERRLIWLSIAAQSGDIEAQLAYARGLHVAFPTTADLLRDPKGAALYKQRALRFAQAAASSGSIDAIDYLASYYLDGVMTDVNPVMALAYLDAYAALDMTAPEDPRRTQLVSRTNHVSLQVSQQQARQILRECCQ
jgi:TPR repeat protein